MNKKPVVLVVMDGVGLSDNAYGNAVKNAYTPTLTDCMANYPFIAIKAHGVAVGLPSDEDMGNSEVGHNALGCGQIYAQGAKLVNQSIATGDIYTSDTWKLLVSNAQGHTIHFIGLLSDGNVHSHIDHLISMVKQAKIEGLSKVRIHVLLDGRDVPETSALIYVEQLENALTQLNDAHFNARIASGGGRMKVTMDRYESDWGIVELGWNTHVKGEGRSFGSASEAIETYRAETNVTDQFLPAFVITENGNPVGKIEDHDSVILFNFRGDRALQISNAFEQENFTKFNRGPKPDVMYAGMLQYDGDLKIPTLFLVTPPHITHTLSEYLVAKGVSQFAISETQKFGHVTYFWNGNRSEKFDAKLETFEEIKSDLVPFEQRPWMQAAQITDRLVEAIQSGEYQFLRCNYPNGDMVGHTGNYQATIIGVESVDLELKRIREAVESVGGILIVTADHGNADEMYEKSKDTSAKPKAKTSHTLNKVPLIILGADITMKDGDFGLANVASTVAELLGFTPDPIWLESVITSK